MLLFCLIENTVRDVIQNVYKENCFLVQRTRVASLCDLRTYGYTNLLVYNICYRHILLHLSCLFEMVQVTHACRTRLRYGTLVPFEGLRLLKIRLWSIVSHVSYPFSPVPFTRFLIVVTYVSGLSFPYTEKFLFSRFRLINYYSFYYRSKTTNKDSYLIHTLVTLT